MSDSVDNSLSQENDDRLSDLAEPILCHILSFLPKKTAVKSSILSREWRYKWASTNVLEIEDGARRLSINKRSYFVAFVDRALLLNDHLTMAKFTLTCYHSYDKARVYGWITNVVNRKVPKLQLSFSRMSCSLPQCLWGCDSLTELTLKAFCHYRVQGSLSFSNLKIMQLKNIIFSNVSESGTLLFALPKLEVLSLNGCQWINVHSLCIDAPFLKCFALERTSYQDPSGGPIECIIKINVGNSFRKLECSLDFKRETILLPDTSTITDAVVYVCFGVVTAEVGPRVRMLLDKLSSVKNLKIGGFVVEALEVTEGLPAPPLPVFCNLKKLIFQSLGRRSFSKILKTFLLNSPVLESLAVEVRFQKWDETEFLPGEVIPCIASHLKAVKFVSSRGKFHDFGMVKFFLKNAGVLEELVLTFSKYRWSQRVRKDAVKMLREFPKRSSRVRLVLDNTLKNN